MRTYFTIGEFAKMHQLSTQTLIYYDQIGLFSPSLRNKTTGYRYYDATQLEVLDTIFILKEIGVPLKEIKQYLENRSAKKAFSMLAQKKEALEEKIKLDMKILNRLCAKLDVLKEVFTLDGTSEISYRKESKQFLYVLPVEPPGNLVQTDIVINLLLHELCQKQIDYNYQIGVIIPNKNLKSKQFLHASNVFSILDQEIDSKSLLIRPAGLYAHIYHKGAYRNETNSYEQLLKKITADGYQILGNSYEECLIDNLSATEEKDYLTKISIRVRKRILD